MAMQDDTEGGGGLDAFFDAGRALPVPSEALNQRVLAGAAAAAAAGVARPLPARRGFWRTLSDSIGGWPAMAGFAAATMAGLWFGMASPDTVYGYFGTSSALTDFMPSLAGLASGG